MKPDLTIETLLAEAARFPTIQTARPEPELYGVNDGKAIGTFVERRFSELLEKRYSFEPGSAASGLDFPDLEVDLKVTSARQPQSSCPFRDARQKIRGLGYGLLVFVYEKTDDQATQAARMTITDAVFVEKEHTADFQTTAGILDILRNDGNADDLVAFFTDRRLPVDDIGARALAEEVIREPPTRGYLTISNALQWRLQFGRVLRQAGKSRGIVRVR